MAQTFDIRFGKAAGLAALLAVPENRFRWKGGGSLEIDAQGISIGVKRGLLALFGGQRMRRIPTENLRAVYREGDALRVEFHAADNPNSVLPFWAGDSHTAAQIVQLLPTQHTVEIEHSTAATNSGKQSRKDCRVLLAIGAMLVGVVAGVWALYPGTPPLLVEVPEISIPTIDVVDLPVEAPAAESTATAPETPVTPSFLEPPAFEVLPPPLLSMPRDWVRSEEFVIPIPAGTAAYEIGRRELGVFEQETTRLESSYRAHYDLLTAGALTTDAFAVKLDEEVMRWWEVTFRIFASNPLADPALLDLRSTMLGAARLWRSFLETYAKGLRSRDHVMMASAFDELSRAQERQSRARLYFQKRQN